MNFEENRLRTFNDWPNNAAVDRLRIARAGFFSTNQGLEVECYACHLKISEWNYGDQVMERHRTLSPECPFVINPATSGNVPRIPPNLVPVSSLYRESLALRLASFENWPIPYVVTPERLANAGFYYLKEGDNTKCPFCNGVVRAWVHGDDPDSEHQRHFPNCPYVINVINPRLNSGERAHGSSNSTLGKDSFQNVTLVGNQLNFDELGVQVHKGSKRHNFATVEARLRSFESWSADLIQTPEVLSQAGFYYEGLGDQVRCFHCDGGLRHWDPHDDPWTEHARWFPNCSFVKLVKGQEFVSACAQGSASQVRPSPQTASRIRREVRAREIQEQLRSPQAVAALAIGLTQHQVKRAIIERLQLTSRPYSLPDALVEAALKFPPDEERPSDDSSSSSDYDRDPIQRPSISLSNTEREARESLAPQNVSTSSVDNKPSAGNSSTAVDPESLPVESNVSLEDENRIIKEARLCKICMNAEMGIVFLPCGHLATCVNCAFNLEGCPVCRSTIKATVRTFFS